MQTLAVDEERTCFGDPEDQHRNLVIAELGLDLQMSASVDNAIAPRQGLRTLCGEATAAGEFELFDPVRMNFADRDGAPAVFGQVPVVAGQLVADPLGKSGRAVTGDGPWGNVDMAQQVIEAHQVVHVGMADENGIDRAQNPLGQVVQLPAVDQDAATGWSDIDEEYRVIEQTGEKARLQITEQTEVLHRFKAPP